MEIMIMGSGEIINGIEMITFGKIQTKDQLRWPRKHQTMSETHLLTSFTLSSFVILIVGLQEIFKLCNLLCKIFSRFSCTQQPSADAFLGMEGCWSAQPGFFMQECRMKHKMMETKRVSQPSLPVMKISLYIIMQQKVPILYLKSLVDSNVYSKCEH